MGKPALQVFTVEQEKEWNRIVASFKNYDVYYLAGYVRAFQIHGDGIPLLFYYNDGSTRGINVVMMRSIIEDSHFKGMIDVQKYFDFATPYGYGGWLVEGENTCQLFLDYERWCLRNCIVSEFIRFHPMIQNHKFVNGQYDVISLGETVAMEISSPERIWENISSKNRNMIRKAIKNNVRIYNGRFPEILEKFSSIYDATMDKDNADSYYYFEPAFYESLLNGLSENVQVFYAQIPDGTVIAASIMLECNGKMNYHLSGSLKKYSSLAPTNLLLYQAARWGCAHGFKSLYLGGGVGSGEDNLFKFKRSFYKGELHRFYIGRKVFDPNIYQELTKMRKGNITNVDYFPVYRG